MRTALLFLAIIIFFSCKKNPLQSIPSPNLPTVTTLPIDSIYTTTTKAQTGGIITDEGNAPVTERGVVYSKDSVPDISNSQKTIDSSGSGNFVSHLFGLTPGTKYFVRAYATNAKGTSYGNEITFTTLEQIPPNGREFVLFKNSSIDTMLYKDSVVGGFDWVEANRGLRNNLNLPKGVFLYVQFDSVYEKVSAGFDTKSAYFVNSGDTMHFIPGINYAQVSPKAWYTLMGNGPYNSKCYYSVHLSGKAETNENQYYCRYSIQIDPTNSFIFISFNSDSTYKCDYND